MLFVAGGIGPAGAPNISANGLPANCNKSSDAFCD